MTTRSSTSAWGEDWGIGLGRDRSGWLVHNPQHDHAAAPHHLARGGGR
jgi:hypothetical protein